MSKADAQHKCVSSLYCLHSEHRLAQYGLVQQHRFVSVSRTTPAQPIDFRDANFMESIQKYCAIDKTVLGSGPCSDERLPSLVVASEIVSPIITGLVTDTG